MCVLAVVAAYIFFAVMTGIGSLWHCRDFSKKTKIIVLIVWQALFHIIIVLMELQRRGVINLNL